MNSKEFSQSKLNRVKRGAVRATYDKDKINEIRDVVVNDEPEDEYLDVSIGLVPIKQIALTPIADEGKPQKMSFPKHVTDFVKANK